MGSVVRRYSAKKLCSQRKNSPLLVTAMGGTEYSLRSAVPSACLNSYP